MFAKMKTGTKVVTGFGIALAAAMIVGAIGYQGIHKLASHVDDFGLVRLPGVQALNAVQAGQLNVGYGIRGLLIPRYSDPQTRSQQYELLANGFKEAEDGLAKYEPLPKSPEEAAAWKEFQELWMHGRSRWRAFKAFAGRRISFSPEGPRSTIPRSQPLTTRPLITPPKPVL